MADEDRVTIQHLDVRFDVEGDAEERAFVGLFRKYIDQWSRAQEEEHCRRRQAAAERALGDREASP